MKIGVDKIDREASNLHDWADKADLMDRGIEVHLPMRASAFIPGAEDSRPTSWRLLPLTTSETHKDPLKMTRCTTIDRIQTRISMSQLGNNVAIRQLFLVDNH